MGYPMVVIHFSPLNGEQPSSTVDKLAGPNVSFLHRAHCLYSLRIPSPCTLCRLVYVHTALL